MYFSSSYDKTNVACRLAWHGAVNMHQLVSASDQHFMLILRHWLSLRCIRQHTSTGFSSVYCRLFLCLWPCNLAINLLLTPASAAVVMHSVACVSLCLCASVLFLHLLWLLKALTSKVHFGMQARLQNIYVKFVCQGHRVSVKVTGARNGICERN